MKNLILTFIIGYLASSVSYAGDEKEKVIETIKIYQKALNANDTATIVKLYAKNSVFMPQNSQAHVGIESIENAYKTVFKAIKLDVEFTIHEVEVIGNTAWARTSSFGKTKILANGTTVTEGNNELFILKKEKVDWKIYQYLFSTNQPRQ